MSSHTTQLRYIVEQTLDDLKLERSENNWSAVYSKLGLSDYPIFDEKHREELNNRIIRRYYTREIGAETVGRFALFVRDAMHLIMPYYNKLYLSEREFEGKDIFSDYHIETDFDSRSAETGDSRSSATTATDSNSSSNQENSADDSSTTVYSDTPQSEMIPSQIKDMQYATTATINESSSTSSGMDSAQAHTEGSSTGEGRFNNDKTSEYGKLEHGYRRPIAELIKSYRENILNIDRMVVEDRELKECFLGVYN